MTGKEPKATSPQGEETERERELTAETYSLFAQNAFKTGLLTREDLEELMQKVLVRLLDKQVKPAPQKSN